MPSSKQVENEKRRGTPTQPPRASQNVQQKATFINLELVQEEKTALTSFSSSMDELDSYWERMLSDGYKLTVKYDSYTSCYAAFAFPDDSSSHSGYILTGRGGHPSRAVRQLLFKHFVILEEDWLGAASDPTNRNDPDW